MFNFTACVYSPVRYFYKVSNVGKRGSMLNNYVKRDNCKKKNWHLTFMSKPEKNQNIFEKIHKPSKRIFVLNALFVRNITDVLSTSDIAPEIMGYGLEITKVQITCDYQTVNVFWQIPLSKLDLSENIQSILSIRAPQIRAEMISRNIMGRVPHIFFVRDETNLHAAEFEKALAKADMGPKDQEKIIPDIGLNDIYAFKSVQHVGPRKAKKVENLEVKIEEKPLTSQSSSDMKSNILGLNHEDLMKKVVVTKKKVKVDANNAAVEENEKIDLFSEIPGTSLEPDVNRGKVLKQFYKDKKIMKKERQKLQKLTDDSSLPYLQEADHSSLNFNDSEPGNEPDYLEDEDLHEERF